jgi:hypothetical protein
VLDFECVLKLARGFDSDVVTQLLEQGLTDLFLLFFLYLGFFVAHAQVWLVAFQALLNRHLLCIKE